MVKIGKLLAICAGFFIMLGISTSARADSVIAEVRISGIFGDTIDSVHSNLPDSTYPFPQLRGGSFDGTFLYHSMASLDKSRTRFPYEFVSIDIKDNTGLVVKNINTAPNGFVVLPSFIQLSFGPSFGIPNSIEDLRVFLNGTFSIGPTPPPVDEIIAGVLNFGFLETDGNENFTYWDLPIIQVTLIHTGTYLVPEPSTMLLLASGLLGILGLRRKFKR